MGVFLNITYNQRAEIHFPDRRVAMALPRELPSNTQVSLLVCLDPHTVLFLLLSFNMDSTRFYVAAAVAVLSYPLGYIFSPLY